MEGLSEEAQLDYYLGLFTNALPIWLKERPGQWVGMKHNGHHQILTYFAKTEEEVWEWAKGSQGVVLVKKITDQPKVYRV